MGLVTVTGEHLEREHTRVDMCAREGHAWGNLHYPLKMDGRHCQDQCHNTRF